MAPCSAKTVSLVGLAVTNSVTALVMRMSRTQADPYFTATAVTMTEVWKLVLCLGLVARARGGSAGLVKALRHEIVDKPMEMVMLSMPSMLYIANNVFMFMAISNLDAATFQLTYQIKILIAAVLSVLFLKRSLHWMQWFSCFTLFMGIALVQQAEGTSGSVDDALVATSAPQSADAIRRLLEHPRVFQEHHLGASAPAPESGAYSDPLVGLAAALAGSFASCGAGIYIEKVASHPDISVSQHSHTYVTSSPPPATCHLPPVMRRRF
jgi:drug/metabolite transporter (DMT)-like permease